MRIDVVVPPTSIDRADRQRRDKFERLGPLRLTWYAFTTLYRRYL